MAALRLRQPQDATTQQFGFGLKPVGLRIRPSSGACPSDLVGSLPDLVLAWLAVVDAQASFVGVAGHRLETDHFVVSHHPRPGRRGPPASIPWRAKRGAGTCFISGPPGSEPALTFSGTLMAGACPPRGAWQRRQSRSAPAAHRGADGRRTRHTRIVTALAHAA